MSSLSRLQLAIVPAISLALVLILGGPMIKWLRKLGAGQRVRDDGPQRHLGKEGTPTMGGVLILAGVGVAMAFLAWPTWRFLLANPSTGGAIRPSLAVVAVVLIYAGIGLADDWKKIKRGRSLGLRARQKLLLQFLAAGAFVAAMAWWKSTDTGVLFSRPSWQHLVTWGGFWMVALVATSNAMNLADGLDGLAAGLSIVALIGCAVLALVSGHAFLAGFALALVGACLGFLWFNRHPARLFMGDVGSLSLGAAMAAMAARLDLPLGLVGLCLVPFIEEASVIAQVISFKTTGKRVLRMSPIHHHFELIGWSEQRVVWTFWAVGAAAAAVTVWLCLR